MRRGALLVLGIALVAASCGDDSGTTTAAPTTAVTAAPTTAVTAAPTTAVTAAPTTAVTAAPTTAVTAAPTTAATAAVASGSGCAPPGDTLPDGDWFGFIEGIDTIGDPRLTFDLACHFDGDEADRAAAEDGRSVPVEFRPYVRNQNPKVFDLTVAPGAMVDEFFGIVAFNVWVASIPAESGCSPATGYAACPLWVEISGGAVVTLYGILPEWGGDGRGS